MFVPNKNRPKRKTRRPVNISQHEFSKGYVSTIANARRPLNSFADLTNMEIVQDSIARPRPSLMAYGTQMPYPIVGRGKFTQNKVRKEIFMLNVSGVGKVYTRTDGGSITLIGGNYTVSVWTGFCQSYNRVYIYNGTDKLSYLDLATDTIQTYTGISAPGAPTPTKSGMASTTWTYYYKVSANNAVGTTEASTAGSVQVGKTRENWDSTTNFVTVTWSSVAGATSYNVYVGDAAGEEKLVTTTTGLSFVDDGTLNPDPFTPAPSGNSTQGPILNWMYNDSRNSQLFGIDNANKMYYSAPGTGDFSPYDGGGYIPIDENGDTQLNYVDGFRDGKGTPVITVGAPGASGKGKMFHITFDTLTYGDQVIVYGNVYEANGQSAPYAPRAVVKARDSLWYPTGDAFKSTGTSQNIVNILTTNSVSQGIEPDVNTLSLKNLHKAVGVEYQDKIFFALPVNSEENNQIWYIDLARKNLWVLRWNIAARDMWVYEDSDGTSHFCVLVGERILEFTRSVATEDDGVAFSTRCAYSSLVWDEDGLVMANIRKQYYKFLNPRGEINVSVYGLNKDGVTNAIGGETFTQTVSFTGIGVWDYSGAYKYGDSVGTISIFGKSIGAQKVKTNAKMINQLDWEITTETTGCDYLLSAVRTIGTTNDRRLLGD
jgi:hypothetical protein